MRIAAWEIAFSPVPAAATVVAMIVFSALGGWQFDRAAQKRALEATYRERLAAAPLDLNIAHAPCASGSGDWRRAVATGHWEPAPQILLDNAVVHGRVGYQVFTLLRLIGHRQGVLVDRGWVPAPMYREVAPVVDIGDAEAVVHGTLAPVPFSGLGAQGEIDASLGKALFRVERLDMPLLSSALGIDLLSCTLRLDPEAPQGYVRDWALPGLGAARHVAYALQWYAFGIIAFGIYLLLHVKRVPPDEVR